MYCDLWPYVWLINESGFKSRAAYDGARTVFKNGKKQRYAVFYGEFENEQKKDKKNLTFRSRNSNPRFPVIFPPMIASSQLKVSRADSLRTGAPSYLAKTGKITGLSGFSGIENRMQRGMVVLPCLKFSAASLNNFTSPYYN